MKKNKKSLILVFAILLLSALFLTSCNKFKWKAVPGDKAGGTVVNNHSYAVQHGKFVYFINGKEDAEIIGTKGANKFGLPIKGALCRLEASKFNNLDKVKKQDIKIIVPQIIKPGIGITIYGNHIYYATPSTKTTTSGELLSSYTEYRRVTLDGSKTDEIYLADKETEVGVFTKNTLLLKKGGQVLAIRYNDKKILNKDKPETVVDNVRDVVFPRLSNEKKENIVFFYIQNNEDKIAPDLMISGDRKGTAKVLKKGFNEKANQIDFSIKAAEYEKDKIILYYNETINGEEKFYKYDAQKGHSEIIDEKKAEVDPVHKLVAGEYKIYTANNYEAIKIKNEQSNKIRTVVGGKKIKLLCVKGDILYFITDGKFKAINYKEKDSTAYDIQENDKVLEVDEKDNVVIIGTKLFFYNTKNKNYLYVLDVSKKDGEYCKAAVMVGIEKPKVEKKEDKEK